MKQEIWIQRIFNCQHLKMAESVVEDRIVGQELVQLPAAATGAATAALTHFPAAAAAILNEAEEAQRLRPEDIPVPASPFQTPGAFSTVLRRLEQRRVQSEVRTPIVYPQEKLRSLFPLFTEEQLTSIERSQQGTAHLLYGQKSPLGSRDGGSEKGTRKIPEAAQKEAMVVDGGEAVKTVGDERDADEREVPKATGSSSEDCKACRICRIRLLTRRVRPGKRIGKTWNGCVEGTSPCLDYLSGRQPLAQLTSRSGSAGTTDVRLDDEERAMVQTVSRISELTKHLRLPPLQRMGHDPRLSKDLDLLQGRTVRRSELQQCFYQQSGNPRLSEGGVGELKTIDSDVNFA